MVIKDYDIPIYYIDQDQFDEVIQTVDITGKYRKAIASVVAWCDVNGKTVEQFQQEVSEVKKAIIDYVQSLDTYKDFCNRTLEEIPDSVTTYDDKTVKFNKKLNLYQPDNDRQQFISIDLSSANAQSLIHGGVTNLPYIDLIKKFTTDETIKEYIYSSKAIRQYVYGNLNPKRQQYVEKQMITKVLDFMIGCFDIEKNDIYGYTTDEIILNVTDNLYELWNNTKYEKLQNEILDKFGIYASIEHFYLMRLKPHNFYVKWVDKNISWYNKYPKFKCVPTKYLPQAIKYFQNKPVTDNDLRFILDDDVVRFEKSLW